MLGANDICRFWFSGLFDADAHLEQKARIWFNVDRKTDRYLRKRCMTYVVLASEQALDHWSSDAQGVLAQMLLLDRVSRACFRHTSLEFDNDAKARKFSLSALDAGVHTQLEPLEQLFLLFPLLASDRLQHQQKATPLLDRLVKQAEFRADGTQPLFESMFELNRRNMLLLQKFNRFPHRAAHLGHGLSASEMVFINEYDWQSWL